MIKISTSILSAKNRISCIENLNTTNTDFIHLDIMDGHFVNNTQMTFPEIITYSNLSKKKIDAHLMVDNPLEYLPYLQNKNIEYITFHKEINQDINKIISKIKESNIKVGISIKPSTKVEEIKPYINLVDLVLIMSVEPGFGGQQFIPSTIEKIKTLKENYPQVTIEIDGGINDNNIENIKKYIDIAVVGSYITNNNNYQEAINNLKK